MFMVILYMSAPYLLAESIKLYVSKSKSFWCVKNDGVHSVVKPFSTSVYGTKVIPPVVPLLSDDLGVDFGSETLDVASLKPLCLASLADFVKGPNILLRNLKDS